MISLKLTIFPDIQTGMDIKIYGEMILLFDKF